eukprot:COSAG05_NODE_11372_length_516_cov_2.965854_1_plen_61_part_10
MWCSRAVWQLHKKAVYQPNAAKFTRLPVRHVRGITTMSIMDDWEYDGSADIPSQLVSEPEA